MTIRLRATFLAGLISIFAGAPRLVAETLNFADFAAGGLGTGTPYWDTTFSTVNTSAVPIACTLSTFGNNGLPLILTTNLGTASTFSFTIPVGGSKVVFTLSAGGTGGTILEGYAKEICDNGATAAAAYTLSSGGQPVTSVGVLPSYPADTFISPANALTGIALANIDPVNSLALAITAKSVDGSVAGVASKSLLPLNHISFNLGNAFTTPLPSDLASVEIQASNSTMVGLSLGVQPNPTGFVLSAIPSIAVNRLSNLSGTLIEVAGPNPGSTGIISITNFAPVGTGTGNATVSTTLNGLSSNLNVAIDEGLWYLHATQRFNINSPPSPTCLGGDFSASLTFNPSLASYSGTAILGCGSAPKIVIINSLK